MVVCEVGDKMERIGFGWIDHSDYKRYDKDGIWDYDKLEEPILLFVRAEHLVLKNS